MATDRQLAQELAKQMPKREQLNGRVLAQREKVAAAEVHLGQRLVRRMATAGEEEEGAGVGGRERRVHGDPESRHLSGEGE